MVPSGAEATSGSTSWPHPNGPALSAPHGIMTFGKNVIPGASAFAADGGVAPGRANVGAAITTRARRDSATLRMRAVLSGTEGEKAGEFAPHSLRTASVPARVRSLVRALVPWSV